MTTFIAECSCGFEVIWKDGQLIEVVCPRCGHAVPITMIEDEQVRDDD